MLKWVVTSQSSAVKNKLRGDAGQQKTEGNTKHVFDFNSAVCNSIEEDDVPAVGMTSLSTRNSSMSDYSTDDSNHNTVTSPTDDDSVFSHGITNCFDKHTTTCASDCGRTTVTSPTASCNLTTCKRPSFERRRAFYRKKDDGKRRSHSSQVSSCHYSRVFSLHILDFKVGCQSFRTYTKMPSMTKAILIIFCRRFIFQSLDDIVLN